MKKIQIKENDPDYEIKKYLNEVKPHKSFRGIREDDMWVIISNVQKYYHEKTEKLKAEYQGIVKGYCSELHQNITKKEQ